MTEQRRLVANCRRWVIKLGSSLVTDNGRGLRMSAIEDWTAQIAKLRGAGYEIVLVSSGSIAEGLQRLGRSQRPQALHELQAAAAVGQMGLIQAYENAFNQHAIRTAQVLLTHADLADRQRYLNARSALRTLISYGVIPVINENDTVTFEEIKFGDNDQLAAMVANLIEAELLLILTDQAGLFDADPTLNPQAKLIAEGLAGDPELRGFAGTSTTNLGRGGMITKLDAAERAARSGTATVIADGKESNVILRISRGEQYGSLLRPSHSPLVARKQWLVNQLLPQGQLTLDAGATRVLQTRGSSLLAVGVNQVTGRFSRGELVLCLDPGGMEIARGLVNYSADETARLVGQPSHRIEQILGYVDEPELIHRDNLVITRT